ncbi:MAG: acetyl-CoA carboxylase, carboxyltransferase subunit beta [Candidatus Hydrogenedentes bacterium]|nr:acetyl-CoA carboxylase, carboxyltransferase subunit beta [Candidatus Hydrogenedentota bacterium]
MPFLKRRRFVSVIGRKSSVPDGMFTKCPGCEKPVSTTELEENVMVCPACGHHSRISARQRLAYLLDSESFAETHAQVQSADPLGFVVPEEKYSYPERVKKAHAKTDVSESIVTGFGAIESTRAVFGAMDFAFLGGSMGSALGEKFCRAADDAIRERVPYVVFTSSGGARMDEGILGLMQMAKTSDAVRALNEAAVPYISVLTHPTTGGVYASFASLGDILIAEPGAQIGFAGPRLIEGALKVKLPEGFQSAESQYNNGFVDCIVPRPELRGVLARLLKYLAPQ